MGKNGMIQWAPGTRLQRLSRVDDDERYRTNFERSLKKTEGRTTWIDMFQIGDPVLVGNQVCIAEAVDYNNKTISVGGCQIGFTTAKRVPYQLAVDIKEAMRNCRAPDFGFRCEVVTIKMEVHPNADHLAVVIVGGNTVVVGLQDFKDGDKAVFIPAGARLPKEDGRWHWMRPDRWRVRVRSFRGVKSHGILVRCPEDRCWVQDGFDLSYELGCITHYKKRKFTLQNVREERKWK